MRYEQLHEAAGRRGAGDLWTSIATSAWYPSAPDASSAKDSSSGPAKKSSLELDDKTLAMPMDIYSSEKRETWVLPIGANSDDKKKDVPLEAIEKPDPRLPDPWGHPGSSWMDGKCGITGVSNMLRLYKVEKPPADIDCSRYRSYGPGLRVDKFASNLRELSGMNFNSCSIEDGREPLDVLRNYIKEGRPVAIQYMTSPTNAHWVVVTGVTAGKDGTHLEVQSWGSYHRVKWQDIENQWRRGYGGPYPHVVGDEASPLLKKSR